MDNGRIHREALQILQDPTFHPNGSDANPADDWTWLKRLLDFFPKHATLEGSFDPFAGMGPFGAMLIKLLALAALGCLLFWLVAGLIRRFRAFSDKQRQKSLNLSEAIAHQTNPPSWLALSGLAASKGDFRAAVHYLFLDATGRLTVWAGLTDSPACTSREIEAGADGAPHGNAKAVCNTFHSLRREAEPRWFGATPTDDADYRQFEQRCQSFYRLAVDQASGASQ